MYFISQFFHFLNNFLLKEKWFCFVTGKPIGSKNKGSQEIKKFLDKIISQYWQRKLNINYYSLCSSLSTSRTCCTENQKSPCPKRVEQKRKICFAGPGQVKIGRANPNLYQKPTSCRQIEKEVHFLLLTNSLHVSLTKERRIQANVLSITRQYDSRTLNILMQQDSEAVQQIRKYLRYVKFICTPSRYNFLLGEAR